MEHVLVLDNYDSFTYNLVHYIEADGNFKADVIRNDEIDLSVADNYQHIVLSPGPGLPAEAGILNSLVKELAPSRKMLGVCLGQQAICEVYGGRLKNLDQVLHGISTDVMITDTTDPLFKDIPETFAIGRYHSWVVNKDTLPEDLKIIAVDREGEIMAVRHKSYDLCAVQFHPESVLTEHGYRMIQNWLYI